MHLKPNQLATRIALFFEPIGEYEPAFPIIGSLADRFNESRFGVHRFSHSRYDGVMLFVVFAILVPAGNKHTHGAIQRTVGAVRQEFAGCRPHRIKHSSPVLIRPAARPDAILLHHRVPAAPPTDLVFVAVSPIMLPSWPGVNHHDPSCTPRPHAAPR